MITSVDATSALMQSRPSDGGTVDDDVVVPTVDRLELLLEDRLASELGDQLELGAAQIDVGGDEIEPHALGVQQDVGDVDAMVGEQVVDRSFQLIGPPAPHVDGQMTLGIEIDREDLRACLSDGCREVHRGRRLADAALLIRDRNDPRHGWRGVKKIAKGTDAPH